MNTPYDETPDTNMYGVPIEQMVLTVFEQRIPALCFVEWVRDLARRIPYITNEIEEITPADRFILQLVRAEVFANALTSSGTCVTLPDDVRQFIRRLC